VKLLVHHGDQEPGFHRNHWLYSSLKIQTRIILTNELCDAIGGLYFQIINYSYGL